MKKISQNTFDVKRNELISIIKQTLTGLDAKLKDVVSPQLSDNVTAELTKIVDGLGKEVTIKINELKSLMPKPQPQQQADDQLPGGDGDDISEEDVDKDELKLGIEDETEHTTDKDLAKEIALDHLSTDPKYYSESKIMEDAKEKLKSAALTLPGVVKVASVAGLTDALLKDDMDLAKDAITNLMRNPPHGLSLTSVLGLTKDELRDLLDAISSGDIDIAKDIFGIKPPHKPVGPFADFLGDENGKDDNVVLDDDWIRE